MLRDKKILESERNAVYVKSNPGKRLTGTVQENKDAFDKFPQLVMSKFNELIDLMTLLGYDNIPDRLNDTYTISQANELVETETNELVKDIQIDLTTGVIKIIKKNGTVASYDTALEKVPATFNFVEESNQYYIEVTNVDGTKSRTNVTNLMNLYEFSSGDTILFTNQTQGTKTTIKASVKDGSISWAKLNAQVKAYFSGLEAELQTNISVVLSAKTEAVDASQTATGAAASAASSANSADSNAKLSKSYAVGGTGKRAGEETDNSKYYSEMAKESETKAKQSAIEAQAAANVAVGFEYLGAWSSSTSYTGGQLVSYSATVWTAARDNINSVPYEGSNDWIVFVGLPPILDLGDFDTEISNHMFASDAHESATFDANNTEATTQATLTEHEIAPDAHGNINIDGGGI